MKLIGVISTAVLSLTLGVAAPVYAQQEQRDQQEEQKAKPAQEEKKAQPEKSAKQEEKPAAQQEKNTKPEEKNAQQRRQERQTGREECSRNSKPPVTVVAAFPTDRFKANFGQQHSFRVSQADYRNHRFQYGGYSFGFVDPWPSNWLYTQDVYVIEIDGVYYLCNPIVSRRQPCTQLHTIAVRPVVAWDATS